MQAVNFSRDQSTRFDEIPILASNNHSTPPTQDRQCMFVDKIGNRLNKGASSHGDHFSRNRRGGYVFFLGINVIIGTFLKLTQIQPKFGNNPF
jgi:hypothetical protein